jgi:hypothetical protein
LRSPLGSRNLRRLSPNATSWRLTVRRLITIPRALSANAIRAADPAQRLDDQPRGQSDGQHSGQRGDLQRTTGHYRGSWTGSFGVRTRGLAISHPAAQEPVPQDTSTRVGVYNVMTRNS